MNNFELKPSQEGKVLVISVSGSLSDGAEIQTSFDLSGVEKIVMDLESVKPFNSVGIKSWGTWIKAFGEKASGVPIHFQNCPASFIDAANLIQMMMPEGAIVESFYVPYYSEETSEETSVKFENGTQFSADRNGVHSLNVEEEIKLDGTTYEIDVVPTQYFRFLERLKVDAKS